MLPSFLIPAERTSAFIPRTWVLPHLLAWLERPGEPVFLVTGGPGCGMTMLIAWLAAAGGRSLWPAPADPADALRLERIRSQVAAAYFCSASRLNLSPRTIAQDLANQLVRSVPEFASALVSTLAERVKISATLQADTISGGQVSVVHIDYLDLGAWDDEASFVGAICEPLNQLYASGYTKPILILCDALDEAHAYSGRISLVDLLSRSSAFPPPVRFLAAARPDPRLLRFFRSAPSLDLVSDAPDAPGEIAAYVAARLASALPELDPAHHQELTERIAAQAGGVFLAARLLVDDCLAAPARLTSAPGPVFQQKVSDIYYAFLNRELGRDLSRWFTSFRPLLGLIAVSRGFGFTRPQLESLLAQPVAEPLAILKPFLAGDLPDGPFRLFDRSFADFLLSDPQNRDYHISAAEMHRKITDFYLQKYRSDWTQCDSYGLYYLVEHALACPMDDQQRQEVFDSLVQDSFIRAIQEQTGWLHAFIENLKAQAGAQPLWTARQCVTLVLVRTPNSLVIQHALRLLIQLRPHTGRVETAGDVRQARLADLVDLLAAPPPDLEARLLALLDTETDPRLRGAIALGMAETGLPSFASPLFALFQSATGTLSWAAADALIALNHRPLIAALMAWYQKLQPRRDPSSRARQQRILYVLGRMHAAEALALKADALAANDPLIIGRAIDFMTFLPRQEGDEAYLRRQLAAILASDAHDPAALGPWADEWLQKRLVRNMVKLHLSGLAPELRRLQEHIQQRPLPQEDRRLPQPWRRKSASRARLLQAVREGLTELQTGR